MQTVQIACSWMPILVCCQWEFTTVSLKNYVGSCLQWNGENWWVTIHVHPDIEWPLFFTWQQNTNQLPAGGHVWMAWVSLQSRHLLGHSPGTGSNYITVDTLMHVDKTFFTQILSMHKPPWVQQAICGILCIHVQKEILWCLSGWESPEDDCDRCKISHKCAGAQCKTDNRNKGNGWCW